MTVQLDVAIIGAGPAGLCLAAGLARQGLRVGLVERQGESACAAPADDGREIALTHASRELLQWLGIWLPLAAHAAPLRRAEVLDGDGRRPLCIEPGEADGLGYLLANHRIRAAAHAAAVAQPQVQAWFHSGVERIETRADGVELQLQLGPHLRAALCVVADGRFSHWRQRQGIAVHQHDFGKQMMVCRMQLERPHRETALEWFGYGQTLALLPLQGNLGSVVLTLPQSSMAALQALPEPAFNQELARRFNRRLGAMQLQGERHVYPLVGVYAHRFVAERTVLLGDAAVGMHPVTAHGFNFGLAGVSSLLALLGQAQAQGRDLGQPALLREYQRRHRRHTAPLYLGTQWIASLYTDDRAPARWLRRGLLQAADRLPPFRRLLAAQLAGRPASPPRSAQ